MAGKVMSARRQSGPRMMAIASFVAGGEDDIEVEWISPHNGTQEERRQLARIAAIDVLGWEHAGKSDREIAASLTALGRYSATTPTKVTALFMEDNNVSWRFASVSNVEPDPEGTKEGWRAARLEVALALRKYGEHAGR